MRTVTSIDANTLTLRINRLDLVGCLWTNPWIILSPAKQEGTIHLLQQIVYKHTGTTTVLGKGKEKPDQKLAEFNGVLRKLAKTYGFRVAEVQ